MHEGAGETLPDLIQSTLRNYYGVCFSNIQVFLGERHSRMVIITPSSMFAIPSFRRDRLPDHTVDNQSWLEFSAIKAVRRSDRTGPNLIMLVRRDTHGRPGPANSDDIDHCPCGATTLYPSQRQRFEPSASLSTVPCAYCPFKKIQEGVKSGKISQ